MSSSSWAEGGCIRIISVPLEMADAALVGGGGEAEDGTNINSNSSSLSLFSHKLYLKGLYKRIRHWLDHRELVETVVPPSDGR